MTTSGLRVVAEMEPGPGATALSNGLQDFVYTHTWVCVGVPTFFNITPDAPNVATAQPDEISRPSLVGILLPGWYRNVP